MEHSKEHSASLSSHLAMHNMAFKQAGSLKQSEILILNSDCVTLEPDFVDPDSTSQIIVKKRVNVYYQATVNKKLDQVPITSLVYRNTSGIIYRKACLDFIGTVAHKVFAPSHVRHCRDRPKCGEEQTRASKDVCGIGHLCLFTGIHMRVLHLIWAHYLRIGFTQRIVHFSPLRSRSRKVGLTNKYSLNAEDCYTNCCQLEAWQLIRGISQIKNILGIGIRLIKPE